VRGRSNFSLNVSETKKLTADCGTRRGDEHTPIHIDGIAVEWVESFKFLSA
jgi:hypothetical protein